jgi:hypothetical protein
MRTKIKTEEVQRTKKTGKVSPKLQKTALYLAVTWLIHNEHAALPFHDEVPCLRHATPPWQYGLEKEKRRN